MKFSKRKFAFLILLLLIFTAAIPLYYSRDLILLNFIEWQFNNYVSQNLGRTIVYDSITPTKDGFHLTNLSFVKPLVEKGADFDNTFFVKEAYITYYIHPFTASTEIKINLIMPNITLEHFDQQLPQIANRKHWNIPFFNSDVQLTISNGQIILSPSNAKFSNSLTSQQLTFEIELYHTKKNTTAFLRSSIDNKSNCRLQFHSNEKTTRTEIIFDQFPVDYLTKACSLFYPTLKIWKGAEGELSGDMQLVSNINELPLLEGQVNFDHVTLQHIKYPIKLKVEKAFLQLLPQNNHHKTKTCFEENNNPFFIFPLFGQLEISNGIVLSQDEHIIGEDFKGNLFFQPDFRYQFTLSGNTFKNNEKVPIDISGYFQHSNNSNCVFDILASLELSDEETNTTQLKISSHQPQKSICHFDLDFQKLQPTSFAIFKDLSSLWLANQQSLPFVSLEEGMMDGSFSLLFEKNKLMQAHLHHFLGKDIHLLFSNNVNIHAVNVQGQLLWDSQKRNALNQFDLSLEQFVLEIPNLPKHLNSFQIPFAKVRYSRDEDNLKFSDFTIPFKWGGLQSDLHYQFIQEKEEFQLKWGSYGTVVALFPQSLHKSYAQDSIEIEMMASISTQNLPIAIKGTLTSGNELLEDALSVLNFGFNINPFHDSSKISNGWFNGTEVPIAKFIEPWLFNNADIDLTGNADIEGQFNSHEINVVCALNNVVFDTSDSTFIIPKVGYQDQDVDASKASYTFNWSSENHIAKLPLNQATYFNKRTGHLFTQITTLLEFSEGMLRTSQLEAFCEDFSFQCSFDLNGNPWIGPYDLKIGAYQIEGKISKLHNLLGFLKNKPLFLELPLEGNLSLSQQGALLYLRRLDPKSPPIFDIQINGQLSDGSLCFHDCDWSVQEIGLKFSYDYKANTLKVYDFIGALIPDQKRQSRFENFTHIYPTDELTLRSDCIDFTDYQKNLCSFDIWLGDRHRDIIRIVGSTVENNNKLSFIFDHDLTHFGSIHPSTLSLKLNANNLVTDFKGTFSFDFGKIWPSLQRFIQNEPLFFSPRLVKDLQGINQVNGNMLLEIELDEYTKSLAFLLKGNKLQLENLHADNLLLIGKKQENTWSIEQFQADDLSFAADFIKLKNEWKIPFFGLRYGQGLVIGFEGQFFPKEQKLSAQLNLFEFDLNLLSDWSKGKKGWDLYEQLPIKGKIKALGNLNIDFFHGLKAYIVDASLNTTLNNLDIGSENFSYLNNINGKLDFKLNSKKCIWKLALNDSFDYPPYELHCENLIITHDGKLTKCYGRYQTTKYNKLSDFMLVFNIGEINSCEISFPGQDSCTMFWSKATHEIQNIQGQIFGAHINLKKTRELPNNLEGSVTLNPEYLKKLLSKYPLLEKFQNLGSISFDGMNYTFDGMYSFNTFPEILAQGRLLQSFDGEVIASNNNKTINSKLIFKSQMSDDDEKSIFTLNDFSFKSLEGNLNIDTLTLIHKAHENTLFCIEIPHLLATNFHLNHKALKHILVQNFELNNFKGTLGGSDFAGFGKVQFLSEGSAVLALRANEEKKESQKLSRNNDEPNVFLPAMGTVEFKIQKDKVYFQKFKDVYSHGKVSKFTLAKHKSKSKIHVGNNETNELLNSYCDFNGNLHLQLCIKPYHLIPKMAELLKVTLKGNVDDLILSEK